ncbi:ADP-ribosylglycohydrolase family protein [Streptomyces sp. NPDC058417]|uniref:ADP-ribosylglycohydrolase family protein n=1 Tax=unclassified Streptomyces TaxID=2593676 RepID=UPI003652A590
MRPPTAPPEPTTAPTLTAVSTPTALLDAEAPPAPKTLLDATAPPVPATLLPPTTPTPASADGEDPPQGPPAPDPPSRTGGAGGNTPADGEAEAAPPDGAAEDTRPTPPEAPVAEETGHHPAPPHPHRTLGLLLGLAAGDAAGWPAARHRASRMPEWTRRLTRELDTFAERSATTTLPVPLALNQPPAPLRLGPSDDAEWATFAAQALLSAADGPAPADPDRTGRTGAAPPAARSTGGLPRDRRIRAAVDLTWNTLAAEVAAAADRAPEVESAVLPLRARISVRAGLGNLATGLRPPATGHDNPHYFDDAACVRACVLAVAYPGDPRRAADLAEFDARYTQDGDGVRGARAMAAAVSLALTGADVTVCVAAALAELPEATEIGRNARHALALARTAGSAFALVPPLEHQIVDHVYSYGVAAAETVPVALALATASGGRLTEAVPAAACLSRVADSAPALTGALTGALGGGGAVPASWTAACRTLSGCSLPRLTGTDLVELAGLLEAVHPAPPGG